MKRGGGEVKRGGEGSGVRGCPNSEVITWMRPVPIGYMSSSCARKRPYLEQRLASRQRSSRDVEQAATCATSTDSSAPESIFRNTLG